MQKRIINQAIVFLLTLVISTSVLGKTNKAKNNHSKKSNGAITTVVKNKSTSKSKTLESFIDKKCSSRECVDKNKLNMTIAKASHKYDVPHNVILGVITVESAFNRKAVSSCGVGLMQICLKWHHEKLKGKNPYLVSTNVDVGTHILKDCLSKNKGSINRSLACYNGGGDKHYVTKVRTAIAEIKQLRLAKNNEEFKWL